MKLFNKYMFMALVAGAAFTACDDDDDFEPGKPAAGGVEVTFDCSNSANVVMGLDDKEVSVILNRSNANGQLTVPVSFVTTAAGVFSAPSSVTFEAGQTSAEYKFTVSDAMKPFNNYLVSIAVDESFSNPYKPATQTYADTDTTTATVNVYPMIALNILKEDYKVKYTGKFVSPDVFEDEWESAIEYSEMQDTYRISEWGVPGYAFTFKMDGNKVVLTKKSFETGMEHPTYGMMSVGYSEDIAEDFFYDPEAKTFHFGYTLNVSAGSFGQFEDLFVVAE